MKVMRMLGLLAVVLCVLGGGASSASAAMVLPSFSVQTGGVGVSREGVLFGAVELKCTDDKAGITMNADKQSGTYDLELLGCKAFGEECHAEGDEKGVILIRGNWKLVLMTIVGVDHRLMLFEVPATTIKCKFLSTIAVVKGSVLGEITQTGANTFNVKTVATSKTGQEFKEYENDEGALVKAQLLSNTNGGVFGESGENVGTEEVTSEVATALEN